MDMPRCRELGLGLVLALGTLILAACIPSPVVPPSPLLTVAPASTEEADLLDARDKVVALALADLAQRLGVPSDQIEVREVRAVVWQDGSLGCPQPGVGATAAEEAGLRILLSYKGAAYHYHSGTAQEPFLCEPRGLIDPTPKADELIPPPGSEID